MEDKGWYKHVESAFKKQHEVQTQKRYSDHRPVDCVSNVNGNAVLHMHTPEVKLHSHIGTS